MANSYERSAMIRDAFVEEFAVNDHREVKSPFVTTLARVHDQEESHRIAALEREVRDLWLTLWVELDSRWPGVELNCELTHHESVSTKLLHGA